MISLKHTIDFLLFFNLKASNNYSYIFSRKFLRIRIANSQISILQEPLPLCFSALGYFMCLYTAEMPTGCPDGRVDRPGRAAARVDRQVGGLQRQIRLRIPAL